MIEHKTTAAATKSIEDRTVIGIAAVHGVIDSGQDRSHPGSFSDIKVNGRNRVRFLWQHNSNEPPIAAINYIREVSRDQLPEKILGLAPEATGGVEVSRSYLNTQRGSEVLEGIKAGAIEEMSYAYEVASYSVTEEEDKAPVRELLALRIFDLSDVSWGMNPYTLGSKAWSGGALTFTDHSEAVVSIVQEYLERAKSRADFRQKEGRVLSTAVRSRITSLLDSLKAVGTDLEGLLKETEPKADPATVKALYIQFLKTQSELNGVITNAYQV
jgi:phage head maturation protease